MKTIEQLKSRIKELGAQATQLSQQAAEVSLTDREQSRTLMLQAKDASKRYQTLIQELKRQQA